MSQTIFFMENSVFYMFYFSSYKILIKQFLGLIHRESPRLLIDGTSDGSEFWKKLETMLKDCFYKMQRYWWHSLTWRIKCESLWVDLEEQLWRNRKRKWLSRFPWSPFWIHDVQNCVLLDSHPCARWLCLHLSTLLPIWAVLCTNGLFQS